MTITWLNQILDLSLSRPRSATSSFLMHIYLSVPGNEKSSLWGAFLDIHALTASPIKFWS